MKRWSRVLEVMIVALLLVGVNGAAFAVVSSSDTTAIRQPKTKKKKKEKEPQKPEESTLGHFEKEAAAEGQDSKQQQDEDQKTDDENSLASGFASLLGSALFEVTAAVFVYGGTVSWHRVRGTRPADAALTDESDDTISYLPRELGEPVIPFAALSAGYQHVSSDVSAIKTRLEAGYGPVALQVDWTHYKEDEPAGDLDLVEICGLYRMSLTRFVEWDVGVGTMNLSGEGDQSGASMTLPLRIQPNPFLGVAFRPAWGWMDASTIGDYELIVSGSLRFASIHAGYRWVKAGDASLDGPIVDLEFHL